MVNVTSLFEYNWHCRRKFLEAMSKLPWEKLVENREASFNSMRNIFLHSLESEQGWIRHLGRGSMGDWVKHEYDRDFPNVDAMRSYMKEVEAESRTYLAKLRPEELDTIFTWQTGSGATNRSRVEDILLHLVEEEIHHRGELLCLMWQINAPPPYTSYTAYLRAHDDYRPARASGGP